MSCSEQPAFMLPAALRTQGFTLRPEREADIHFLMQLYASTRAHDMALVPDWTDEQRQAFLTSQFRAQRIHYHTHFPACRFDVLAFSGAPMGRLYLDARPSSLHIIDIALLPEWCGRGIGTVILQALTGAARAQGKRVGIFVERNNPALRLYRRLGFTAVADHAVYLEMEWSDGDPQTQLKTA